MSKDKPAAPAGESAPSTEEEAPSRRLGRPTKLLLAAAVGLMLAGLVLRTWPAAAPTAEKSREAAPAVRNLAPGETAEEAYRQEQTIESWSGPLFRLGFGFVAGFCVAYALRAVFKLAIIVIGLIVAALVGLQYAGLVAIDWAAIGGHYDSLSAWLAGQAGSVQRFVAGYLPAAGSAGVGLVAGFRRR